MYTCAGHNSAYSPHTSAITEQTNVSRGIIRGLPLTGIEAQTAGLPVLMSDVITPETIVTDNVTTFSLANTADQWADKALDLSLIHI